MDQGNVDLTDETMQYDDRRQCCVCKHSCFFSGIVCQCSTKIVSCLRHSTKISFSPIHHYIFEFWDILIPHIAFFDSWNYMCKCAASSKTFLQWVTVPEIFQAITRVRGRLDSLVKSQAKRQRKKPSHTRGTQQELHKNPLIYPSARDFSLSRILTSW